MTLKQMEHELAKDAVFVMQIFKNKEFKNLLLSSLCAIESQAKDMELSGEHKILSAEILEASALRFRDSIEVTK